ncbi:MAG TPA: class I SAM-dependent methyltransferase [Chitinophagaceae bacterium]|nr:class I SAM-dependent methyltransferase [Chitinophagaceae bacterium]
MPAIVSSDNVNSVFFDGFYKDMWRTLIPGGLTDHEVAFMTQHFQLQAGSRVLDLMCGYGRHSLGLARKGIEVIALDNLSEYIEDVQRTADAEQLPVQAMAADILSFKACGPVDLAICMGNSLNFFDEADVSRILTQVAASLRTGGHLLINSWSLAEIVIPQFKEKNWSYVGDFKFLTDSRYLFHPTRIETESIIIDSEGRSETKRGVDYIYSLSEMQRLLASAGLMLRETYSIPGKKKFALGEPRAYLIAEKV